MTGMTETGAVTETTAPTATGTLSATDVDNPALAFVPATISGSYGALTLLANGQWTYTLDARAEPLAQNQVISEPVTVMIAVPSDVRRYGNGRRRPLDSSISTDSPTKREAAGAGPRITA